MRLLLAVCLALAAARSEASIVTKDFHFQFANGNFDVTSESGIDYSGLFTSGIDYTVEYDDEGTFFTLYDRSTPPNAVNTVDASSSYPVLSDAVITHNATALFDSSGFTPFDDMTGNTYSIFQQMASGAHAWIDNDLTNLVNFETGDPGVHRTTLHFYWTKDDVTYSDRITGLGYRTPDFYPLVVPEASSVATWSLLGIAVGGVYWKRRTH